LTAKRLAGRGREVAQARCITIDIAADRSFVAPGHAVRGETGPLCCAGLSGSGGFVSGTTLFVDRHDSCNIDLNDVTPMCSVQRICKQHLPYFRPILKINVPDRGMSKNSGGQSVGLTTEG
jgi:hypothetical protein